MFGVQGKFVSFAISKKSKNTFYFREYVQHICNIYNKYNITIFSYRNIIFRATGELTDFMQAYSYTRSTILISRELGFCSITYFVTNEQLRDNIEVTMMRCSIS